MKDAREMAHLSRNRRMERDKKELSNGCIWSLILLATILFWAAVGMICCGAGGADSDLEEEVQLQEAVRAAPGIADKPIRWRIPARRSTVNCGTRS